MISENRNGQKRGIDRAGLSDRECADGNPARHLHDGEQRIHAFQSVTLNGDAEHRYQGLSCDHARQMRGAACAGDDHFDSARLRRCGEIGHMLRSAMGGDDATFMRHAESE